MKIAYFDCFSGISGDMIIGALIDLGLDIDFLKKELGKLMLKGFKIEAKKIDKNGIMAVKFNVLEQKKTHNGIFRGLREINYILDNSKLDGESKKAAKKIFLALAMAESKAHGKSIDNVHFHEIGAIDTLVDIAGAVIGIRELGIERVFCSELNVGRGFVEFSHGRFPIPPPATAQLLENIPIYSNDIESELVTPTGAAIISSMAEKFGPMPSMRALKVGHGAGSKDLKQPNVLRIFLGEMEFAGSQNQIDITETNIDNMNPEIYPYVIEKLMENGALDAYLTGITMKKGRPAVKLSVLSDLKDTSRLCGIIFDETTTLGVRTFRAQRIILERETKKITTKYGDINVKVSKSGGKVNNITPEYEDCARIAKTKKLPLKKVYKEIEKNSLIQYG